MYTHALLSIILLFPLILQADLISLTSTDNKTISVSIDDYSVDSNSVAVRINGEGRAIPIPMDRLNEESQKAVHKWNELNALIKYISIDTERVAVGKGQREFHIELSSQSKSSVKGIRIDYSIPIKESQLVKEESDDSNKKKKLKYNKVYEEKILTGSIELAEIEPQSTQMVKTEAVTVATTQLINEGKDKDPKEVTNNHSIKGILLKIFIGDQLIREYESQNGVKQLVDKYKN
ncbi:MAG TPA: hypothetical protein DCX06_09895 [Opitutae bacterium]|nr:hypothetical protein [Opitutae bacterium]